MIHDVILTPLRRIDDERGAVFQMLRCDDPRFRAFGEVYFSAVNEGAVKAWRRHSRLTMNCAVPVGRVLFVLFDDRPDSPSRGTIMEVTTGFDAYVLITVPPGIWNGFMGLGPGMALVANCADLPHDPAEGEQRGPRDAGIPYDFHGA